MTVGPTTIHKEPAVGRTEPQHQLSEASVAKTIEWATDDIKPGGGLIRRWYRGQKQVISVGFVAPSRASEEWRSRRRVCGAIGGISGRIRRLHDAICCLRDAGGGGTSSC
jgi:hypothetical protein